MNDEPFAKLFSYMQNEFQLLHTKLDQTASKQSVHRLTKVIDSFIIRLENTEIEQSARNLQFDRLLNWAREVSKKTGIPLRDL